MAADGTRGEPGVGDEGAASDLRHSMHQAAGRMIDEIIASSESLADEIRREAERDAQEHLARSRRDAEQLVEQVRERISGVFDSLRAEIDELEARAVSLAETAREPVGEEAPEPGPAPEVEPDGDVDADPLAGEPGPPDHSAALTRAGQLAIMGRDRGDIEAVLRSELGVEHPGEIVDEVLPPARPA